MYIYANLFCTLLLFYIYINVTFSTYGFQALNTRSKKKKKILQNVLCLSFCKF